MRGLFLVAAALLVALASLPAARGQVGFDRRGGDYASFAVRSGDPALCAARCERDGRCRAWSFSYPVAERPATCWLKKEVPRRVEDAGSVSGVRGADVIEPRRDSREFSTDRPGGDYRSLDVAPDPTGEACKTACAGEPQCRAWTYARPGYLGADARCYLKNRVMPPHRRPCCISGVER